MMDIIAVTNQKGGVGKTTTAVNVSVYLAKAGRNVLLVDLDPQGNATSGLGFDKNNLEATIYDGISGTVEIRKLIQETNTAGMFLIASNANLAAAEIELVGSERREFQLAKLLEGLSFDYIIIDCPPSLGLLTINALVAARYVLIPVQTEYYALEGLGQLLHTIQLVQGGLNQHLQILGVVMTMNTSRTSLSGQVESEVRKHFGDKVFRTVIPRNVRLAEAPSHGKPIADHDKWSKGARAYKQLAKELDKRLKG